MVDVNDSLLEAGHFYHIYNCSVEGCCLFKESENYTYFLKLYRKYISPVADTYAWVLLGNHFHVMVKIKENVVYKYSKQSFLSEGVLFDDVKWETTELTVCEYPVSIKQVAPALHFSHLFNAYAKYFNKMYKRKGSLFSRKFKRQKVDSERYFRQLIVYIHNNPIHHGFCKHPLDYLWSSYHTYLSSKRTELKRDVVLEWFDEIENFKFEHQRWLDVVDAEGYFGHED